MEGLGASIRRSEFLEEVTERVVCEVLEFPRIEEAPVAGRARLKSDVRLVVIDHAR
jgi:hypothetical protein